MSDVPYEHPGPVPPRPEVPEGVVAGPPPEPPTPDEPPRDQEFRWWAPFAALVTSFLGASFIVGILVVFVEAAGTRVSGERLPTGVTIVGTILQGALFIGTAILFAGIGGRRPSAWSFGLRPARFWRSFGLAFATMVVFYAFSVVWALALGIDESDDLAVELGAKDSTLNLIAVAVMVTLVAPITEEFFFRGFFFPAVSNRVGWIGGALVTGLVFGLIHFGGTDPEFLVPLMVLGFLFCVLYRFTGSLLPCIALHAVNNAVALGVTLDWEPWQVGLAVVLAPCAVLAIAVPIARRARPALS